MEGAPNTNSDKVQFERTLPGAEFWVRTIKNMNPKVNLPQITESFLLKNGGDPAHLRELIWSAQSKSPSRTGARTSVKTPSKSPGGVAAKTLVRSPARTRRSPRKAFSLLRSNRKKKSSITSATAEAAEKEESIPGTILSWSFSQCTPHTEADQLTPMEDVEKDSSAKEGKERTDISPRPSSWEVPLTTQESHQLSPTVVVDSSTETVAYISESEDPPKLEEADPVDHHSLSVGDISLLKSPQRPSVDTSGEAGDGKGRKRSIFDISPVRKKRKKSVSTRKESEPKIKKRISEEAETRYSMLPTTPFIDGNGNSAEEVPISDLLDSDNEGKENYEIEFDKVIPFSSPEPELESDDVSEEVTKSVTSTDEGSSMPEQQQQQTSVEASFSAENIIPSPVPSKTKPGDQKKTKKTPAHDKTHDAKKPTNNQKFTIPKHKNMTQEQKERNRDMPEYAREQGEKEVDEELQKLFENLWTQSAGLQANVDVRTQRMGEIGAEEIQEMKDERYIREKNKSENQNDEERLTQAKEKFKNPIVSDPGRNLSYHGFKMKKAEQKQGLKMKDIKEKKESQFISNGKLVPLSKRSEVEAGTKKLKISEVEVRMKRQIVRIFAARGMERVLREKDRVGRYLEHLKSGQEEQTKFLKFYSDKEEISEDYVKAVEKVERKLHTYAKEYGNDTELRCRNHGEHKFSL